MNTNNAKLNEMMNIIHSFSSVHRYSNKTLLKPENIAEHSSIVGIISLFLYEYLSDEYKEKVELNKLLSYAIFHDFDEIFSGDILNPVKYYTENIKKDIQEYTDSALDVFIKKSGMNYLAKFLSPEYLNEEEKMLSKLADIISVFIKITVENHLGNRLLDIDYNNVVGVLMSEKYSKLLSDNPELGILCSSIVEYSSEHGPDHLLNHSNIMNRQMG
jgi:5'-deoxynucleotidase YfbR-like HD superfamily hydrolase